MAGGRKAMRYAQVMARLYVSSGSAKMFANFSFVTPGTPPPCDPASDMFKYNLARFDTAWIHLP